MRKRAVTRGGGSAARTLVSRGLKKSVDVGCRLRESASEPATCFLTGVWRATVLLGPTPAAINPLMALCPYASTLPRYPLSVSVLFSRSLTPTLRSRCPTTYIPHQDSERDNPSLFSCHPSVSLLFSRTVSSSVALSLFLISLRHSSICLFFPPSTV